MTKNADPPLLFRIVLQVSDLTKAAAFYGELLGTPGRDIPHASRHYFDCGEVILALLDPTADGKKMRASHNHVYFCVNDLEQVHERARALGCLSKSSVHDQPGGEIVKRPWGERSFYVRDPFGNRLCFVDAKTLFTGR